MIEEASGADGQGLPLVRSPLIPEGFRHGFTSRRGGVSGAPFDQLNLGMKWGDARENVLENRRRLLAAAGTAQIHFARQVHGAEVIRVVAGDAPDQTARLRADALCSDAPGLAVGVFVADCIPVLIADARTGAFAAVHAGWRGTVAGVVPAAVRRLRAEFGARPGDLRVALGPAIGPCCFEVGDDVVEAVERAIPAARRQGAILLGGAVAAAAAVAAGGAARSDKARVDLKRLNLLLLEGEGVPPSGIDAGPECTSCDRARFYSYRRDKGSTGQQVGFIARARIA
jgi:YfiH family protein